MKIIIITLIAVLISGAFVVMSADAALMSLKDQVRGESTPDNYTCWDFTQLLVERPNGKFACVSPYTMIKLNWEPHHYDFYHSDVTKDDSIYSVFAYQSGSGGHVSDMKYSIDSDALVIDFSTTNPGKLFIEIPRILLDSKHVECGEIDENAPDDDFFVLADGEEVLFEELLTNDTHRTLEIGFKKDLKQIEIIASCLI